MYAIIKTGGKQYKVSEGDTIYVEKLEAAVDDAVTFDQVLTVVTDGGVKVGKPLVDGAKRFFSRARKRKSSSSSTRPSPTTVVVRAIVSPIRRSPSKRSRRKPA